MTHHLGDQRVVGFRQSFLLRGPLFLFLLRRQRLLLPLFVFHVIVVSFRECLFLLLLPGAQMLAAAAAEPALGFALLAQLPEALLGLRRRRGLGRVRHADGLHRVRPGAGPELRLATVAALRRRAAARGFHRASHREGARCGREAGRRGRTEGPELGARVEARRFRTRDRPRCARRCASGADARRDDERRRRDGGRLPAPFFLRFRSSPVRDLAELNCQSSRCAVELEITGVSRVPPSPRARERVGCSASHADARGDLAEKRRTRSETRRAR